VRATDASNVVYKLIAENNGVLRTEDAEKAGISRMVLSSLAKNGKLDRIAHGRYALPGDLPDELYLIQQRSEKIIFSHETALFLYNMAERTPLLHSLTIPSNGKLSPVLSEGCKIYYVKPDLYELGKCIVPSKMGNVVVAYDIERTVCDILRSRSRIDDQTFAAAIKNYTAGKKQNWNKLSSYAEAFQVTKLLRQYLEVLL